MGRGDLYDDKPWKYRLRDLASVVSILATGVGAVVFLGGYLVLQYRVGEVEALSRLVAGKFESHCLADTDRVARLEERIRQCCAGWAQ